VCLRAPRAFVWGCCGRVGAEGGGGERGELVARDRFRSGLFVGGGAAGQSVFVVRVMLWQEGYPALLVWVCGKRGGGNRRC